jgi:peptidylprolyl isomerase
VQGDGAVVAQGQTIAVNYLGQVYKGAKPFDESFTGNPASFQIGTGAVIKGWDQALVGKTVGSRVIMAVPPELGYGKQGNEGAGIKGTDTLYFVVDILGAA